MEDSMKALKIIRSGSPEKKVSTRVCICHITSFCNLGCSYCVVRNSLNTVQWSRDIFFRNIDRVKEDGTTSTLAFFGGEPFVHPDLLDNRFPLERYDRDFIKRVELNFLHEAKYGTEVRILTSKSEENPELFNMALVSDDKTLLFARLLFAGR